MGRRRLIILCLAALCCLYAAAAQAGVTRPGRLHQVFFADTPDELNIYRVYGAKDGRTLMLVGGIQGDEPGGFLSADLYADISLSQGNLIVVPRANFYSIIKNHRGPDGDMNRQFGDPVTARRHERIVKILKELMAEADLFLNLHDGSGFFRPTWQSPLANPNRYGQSLIADAATYRTKDGRVLDLQGMAGRVLDRVNRHIENPRFHLRFNNHRTAESSSIHKEQRLSATYYALTRCDIPAFGVETSKSLPNVSMKVRHHNLAINAFMEEIGVIPENPGSYMEPTEFKYLVVSVNNGLPVVVTKDSGLTVSKGDRVKVLHIEANCERGLTCDIAGLGSVNDLRQAFAISSPRQVLVRKDGEVLERVDIRVAPQGDMFAPIRSQLQYFLLEVEGERRLLADGERLTLVKGDKLRLVDLLSNLGNRSGLEVNFKGYVPRGPQERGRGPGIFDRHRAGPAAALVALRPGLAGGCGMLRGRGHPGLKRAGPHPGGGGAGPFGLPGPETQIRVQAGVQQRRDRAGRPGRTAGSRWT